MPPRCRIERDGDGTAYIVERDGVDTEEVCVWWSRTTKDKAVECLTLRQETGGDNADVLMLSLGQAYDLIDALNRAVMDR
jgi:hypothetical protein